MASLNLEPDELKAIESTRSRLYQLANSFGSLKRDVYESNPLPTVASLQAQSYILQQNLASLLEITTTNADLFQRVVVHPSTNYPGRMHEAILTQLLRKKLEPDVEVAVDTAKDAAIAQGIGPASFPARAKLDQHKGLSRDYDDSDEEEGYAPEEDDEEEAREPLGLGDVWRDAREFCIERVTEFIRDEVPDMYTKEEREMGVEKVRTGLRRDLEEDESDEEDEDDEDEEMVDALGPGASAAGKRPDVKGVEPEVMLWCAARGDVNVPAYLEIESRKAQETRKR